MASIIWISGSGNQMPLKEAILEAESLKKKGLLSTSVNDYLFRHGSEYHIAKGNRIGNETTVIEAIY